jgi:GH25 family lysozyme M1 (1,4-beta-N-acetylmuramidase)
MKKQLFLITILSFLCLNVSAQTQLITNGNFSSSSGWTTSGNWYIGSPNTCYNSSTAFAYAGDASGNPVINEWGNLKQTVTIPSNATSATLSFYTSQNTQETATITAYDYIEVYLYNASGSTWLNTLKKISNLDASSYPGCQSYKKYTYDVSAYIGQTIQLWFHVYSDGGPKNTLFRVDDVSLTYIAGCSTPSNPANPTSNSPQTGSVTITRTGSPPSGVTWYWQGTSCGTSTSLGSGTTYTANSSGTYYIRAYNNTGGCWSTSCGSVNVSVTASCTTPSTPGNPTSNSPQAGSITLTRTGSPPSGVTWYWQGTSCGTSTSLGSGTTYTATASGTYYIRAYNNTGGCWSTGCGSVGVTISSSTSVSGIDVSHWNGTINWSQVKAAEKVFAFAKCSEGLTGADDDKFSTNMINGKNAGVVMGAYHIARPDNRPTSDGAVQEANHFLSLASSFIGTGYLPPALDLEPAYVEGQSKSILSTWVQAWMTTVQNATGVAPVIYTTHWDANNLLNSSLNIYKLWIANYESNPLTPPTNLGIWSTWTFNQYSETGTVSGISSAVDLDVFNGDMTAFNNLIGTSSAPPTVTISSVSFPSTVNTGDSFNLNYTITTTGSVNVILGASISRNGQDYSDASNDDFVSLSPIMSNYRTRSFDLSYATPNPVPSGVYDVIVALWNDKNGNGRIDTGDERLTIYTSSQKLTISPITSSTILTVRPDKLVYLPGQTIIFNGSLKTSSGQPVPNTRIPIDDPIHQICLQGALTDNNGNFEFPITSSNTTLGVYGFKFDNGGIGLDKYCIISIIPSGGISLSGNSEWNCNKKVDNQLSHAAKICLINNSPYSHGDK